MEFQADCSQTQVRTGSHANPTPELLGGWFADSQPHGFACEPYHRWAVVFAVAAEDARAMAANELLALL